MDRSITRHGRPVSLLWLCALVVVLVALMSAYSVFTGSAGGPVWALMYYGKFLLMIPVIVLAFTGRSLRQSEKRAMGLCAVLVMLPTLAGGLWSVVLWMVSDTQLPYITRGVSNLLYAFLALAGGISIGMLFKNRAPALLAWSCILVYALSLLLGLASNGGSFLSALNPLGYRSSTDYVELHEISYVLGLLMLYMILMNTQRPLPHRTLLLVLCLVFFIIAGKRIGYLGFLFCLVYGFIVKKSPVRTARRLLVLGEWCALIVCFVYIIMTMSDDLISILNDLGISSMGRNIIFNYFRQFGEMDLSFLGNGAGFVSRQFDYTTAAELYNMASIKALHNDLFKIFLEYGTVGSILWLWFWNRFIPRTVTRKAGFSAGLNCAVLIFFSMITYMTDNTEGYYMYQATLACLLFLCIWQGMRGREVRMSLQRQTGTESEPDTRLPAAAGTTENPVQEHRTCLHGADYRKGRLQDSLQEDTV